MKRGSTGFLRAVICLIGIAAVALYAFALPALSRGVAKAAPEADFWRYAALAGWYATAIPVFFALCQAVKLLGVIDNGNAFSESAVKALRHIQHSAIAISVLLAAGMPLVYLVADADDAPGLILLGAAIVGAPLVIATFFAILHRLLREAIDIKSENDSTI